MVLNHLVAGPPTDPDVRHVRATHDPDTGHWWAESADLPGLVSEAPTLEALMDRVSEIVPELLDLNGGSGRAVILEFRATRQVQTA